MASNPPFKIARIRKPEEAIIEEMIRIYVEAYKNDQTVQLQHILPDLVFKMSDTIKSRIGHPECLFIVAKAEGTDQIVGWLALVLKSVEHRVLHEENVLFAQYALIPDMVVKWRQEGINVDKIKTISSEVFKTFKEAREKQLPDKHCIVSTLVVDPEYQNKGVASALLVKAINLTEVFLFPIWVQAPEAYQILFEKHLFQEVGEYQLDPKKYIPNPAAADDDDDDYNNGRSNRKGKGKSPAAAPTLQKHVWKFMIRQKPLEKAVELYAQSKVHAEEIAEMDAQPNQSETEEENRERNWISKMLRKFKAPEIKKADSLLCGNIPTTTITLPTPTTTSTMDNPPTTTTTTAEPDADIGPSTPLLIDSRPNDGSKLAIRDKALKDKDRRR